MTEGQKGTDYYSMPQAARERKKYTFTLSDEAASKLEKLARRRGEKKSQVIEALIESAR